MFNFFFDSCENDNINQNPLGLVCTIGQDCSNRALFKLN